jgi:dihydropteroate synthase
MTPFTLNIKGRLTSYDHPVVMGIVNVTPDSFFDGSRAFDSDAVARRVATLVAEGADMIDIGAYSSRPGAEEVSAAEETERLGRGLEVIRRMYPDIPVSVDTFRADVARTAIKDMGADIINDISTANIDPDMVDTVAELNVPYILMHMRGTPQTMTTLTEYKDVTADVLAEMGEVVNELALRGVNDIIIDPGFGFAKTLEQNYELMANLELFRLFHRPVLVGISRKSMLTKPLGIPATEALNATTALNVIALDRGADILRVHDVAAAKQAVTVWQLTDEAKRKAL